MNYSSVREQYQTVSKMRVGTCRMGSFCLNGTVVLYIWPLSLPNMTSIEKKERKNEWTKKVKGIMIDE